MDSASLNPAVFNAIDTMMPLSFEKKVAPATGPTFTDMVFDALGSITDAHEAKTQMAEEMAAGKDVDTHSVMIAQAKEDVMTRFASTSVTKIASAYQTLMNMQI